MAASRERDGINEQLTKADKRHKAVQMVAPADGAENAVPPVNETATRA